MATQTTRSLVAGARSGDERAWNRIVTEYGPKIRGYARARGVGDPDDLTQDVFVAAASQIQSFDGDDEQMRSWLFSIAYRQIVNRYRESSKQTAPLSDGLIDPGRSPEDEILTGIESSQAVAALAVLSQMERDVVLMRVVGDLDTKDVAAAVGKTPGNVRVIQSRAMEKLRSELERRGYGVAGVWAATLVADVVMPIRAAQAAAVASLSATGVATAGAMAVPVAVGAAGIAAGKIAAAVALVAALGAGAAAVTGNLPAPAQRWVSGVADRIGIDLPATVELVDDLPLVPDLPDLEPPLPTDLGEVVPFPLLP